MFILLSFPRSASAEGSLFQDLFKNKNAIDVAEIKDAQEMYNKFSGPVGTLDFDIKQLEQDIKNPFLSQLPEDKKIEPQSEKYDPGPVIEDPEVYEPPPEARISGLVWNSDQPQAIVNGSVVNVGDDLAGWTIIDISKEGVMVESVTQVRHLIEP